MIIEQLNALVSGCIGAAPTETGYRLDFEGSSRAATTGEILQAAQADKMAAINAECRARLTGKWGEALEQGTRWGGGYGPEKQAEQLASVTDHIDASNVASNAVLGAADIAAVEAVTVAWPAI
jgi:hypothetical protein